jgi:hypothetical protein
MGGEKPTWGAVWRDPALLITFWVTGQFFLLILLFSIWPSRLDPEAKQTLLQAYVVGFTAAWGYWLGSSASSRSKDQMLAGGKEKQG